MPNTRARERKGKTEQYDYDAFGKPYFYNASGTLLTSSGWGNRFLFSGSESSLPGGAEMDCIGRMVMRPRERERTSQWLNNIAVYDFRNRHYLPELGRFIQPDPKEFDAGEWSELGSREMDCIGRMVMRPRERERTSHYNLYRYCHNDPVNKWDPFGLADLEVAIWNASVIHGSVGHVYIQNLSATATGNPNPAISSPFPANGRSIGQNVQKNLADATKFEGRAPDRTFTVHTDPKNDSAVQRTMTDHAQRPTWRLNARSSDETNCAVAGGAALKAGGYKDAALDAASNAGIPLTPDAIGNSLSQAARTQSILGSLGLRPSYPKIQKDH